MDIRMVDTLCVAMLDKNIDTNNAEEIGRTFMPIIEGGTTRILMDFSRNEYISSIGLGMLIMVHKKLQKMNGTLALAAMNPKVYRIFQETQFTTIFPIFTSLGDALKELGAPKIG